MTDRRTSPNCFTSMTMIGVLAWLLWPQPLAAQQPRPEVWMGPPAFNNGRALRELFERPDEWRETRSLVDVVLYADLHFKKQFTDDELRAWLPKLDAWGVKLALEVGAIKEWGTTGQKAFDVDRPGWERLERLGGRIHAVAMDEPLLCTRRLEKPLDYAVRETAAFIALVRKHFPHVLVGDIESYPSISLADHQAWIESLQRELAAMKVRGLDFYRLDVNWVEFTAQDRGSWREVKRLEQYCRRQKLPFGLIYWSAVYPAMIKQGLADDGTWYVSTMEQGYDYALVQGRPDHYVIQSWVGGPPHMLPESGQFTFTRSVRDFARKFVKPANR